MKDRLLPIAMSLVAELNSPNWEGGVVRELIIKLQDVLNDEDRDGKQCATCLDGKLWPDDDHRYIVSDGRHIDVFCSDCGTCLQAG